MKKKCEANKQSLRVWCIIAKKRNVNAAGANGK